MRTIKIYIATLLFILLSFRAEAERFLVHTYTEEDGLPSSYVNAVAQDGSGYMWVATDKGFCMYDGNSWKDYYDGKGEPIRNILKLKADETDNIWALSYKSGFEIKNYKYPNQKAIRLNVNIPNFEINKEVEFNARYNFGKAQFTVVVNHFGLFFYNANKWITINKSSGLPNNDVYSADIGDASVYIGASSGLWEYKGGKLDNSISKRFGLTNECVYKVKIEGSGESKKIWLLTDDFIGYIYRGALIKLHRNLKLKPEPTVCSYNVVFNYFGAHIIAEKYHVNLFGYQGDSRTVLNTNSGLIDNGSSDILVDREGIIWICSKRGLSKISSLRFVNYGRTDKLLDDEVTTIIEQTPGKYILGHNFGITITDFKSFHNVLFRSKELHQRVLGAAKDEDGNIWLASYKNGLAKIDKKQKLKWYSPEKLGVDWVVAVAVDKNNRILFTDNFNVYELVDSKAKMIMKSPKPGAIIRTIFLDKDNNICLTTNGNGLFIQKNNQTLNYKFDNYLEDNIYNIYQDDDGSLLVASAGGLFKLWNGKYFKFNLGSGLFNKPIFSIVKDKDGRYWLGTDAGVYSYDKGRLYSYGVKEGLAGLETNRSALLVDSYGRLLVGTNRGLSIYKSNFDKTREILPFVQLKDIDVRGKSRNALENNYFSNDENDLIFNFKVISFYNEKKNSILYKLEPFENEWIESSNLEEFAIRYHNLNPGVYRFKLKAKNALGVWSEEVQSGEIHIEAPFYKKLWFIAALAIAMGGGIYFSGKISNNRRYRARLEEEVRERTALLEASERRYRQMFFENNALMIIIDPEDGRFLDANPESINFLGFNRDEIISQTIFDFNISLKNDSEETLDKLKMAKEVDFEYHPINSEKNTKYLKAHLSRIEIDNRSLIFCIVNDVTEQKKAEKELKKFNEDLENMVLNRTKELEEALEVLNEEIFSRIQAEEDLIEAKNNLELSLEREKELSKLKSRFISMVSHEYRTPLTVIFSGAELIREFIKIGNLDACVEYSKRIQQSVKTLTDLLEGVMAIGDDAVVNVFKEDFAYNDFLNYIIDDFDSKIKSSHQILVEYLSDNNIIRQDKNLLRQIITQILSNAVKFSDKESMIIVTNSIVNGKLEINICDRGKGIAPENIDQIFEPFFRTDDEIGLIPGTGLGLSIVKKNMQALGGEIKVESVVGEGSIFSLILSIN
jgi:PAS domain S-box-containing protein